MSNSTYRFSIDALPFVLNSADEDEIIHLDRYYDRQINPTEYGLATEGKINYYLYPRESGRGESFGTNYNIDIFGDRGKKTASGGKNRFSVYASAGGGTGYYLFKLDWGDGSPLEYTNQPKLLEGTTLLEHFYNLKGLHNCHFEHMIGSSGLMGKQNVNLARGISAHHPYNSIQILPPSASSK